MGLRVGVLVGVAVVQPSSAISLNLATVSGEYETAATKVDVELNDVAAGTPGQMLLTLRSLGGCHGLACGFFGEASDSFHDLLKTVAKCHAEEVFLERGCETPDEAVPILASELYRDWGTKFTKYRAQFFLSAVHFASPHFATRPAVRSARMTTAAQQDADNAFYAHARHT